MKVTLSSLPPLISISNLARSFSLPEVSTAVVATTTFTKSSKFAAGEVIEKFIMVFIKFLARSKSLTFESMVQVLLKTCPLVSIAPKFSDSKKRIDLSFVKLSLALAS